MREIGSWLASRATVESLRVAAAALVHIGRRIDLGILTAAPVEPRETANAIIADTTFAVMRRTLR